MLFFSLIISIDTNDKENSINPATVPALLDKQVPRRLTKHYNSGFYSPSFICDSKRSKIFWVYGMDDEFLSS